MSKKTLEKKIVMITGGTGSFGKEVSNFFIESNVSEVRIFSRDEKKQEDMRKNFNNPKLKFYIGDVRDFDSVNEAFRNVDFVFHAAALKQVPSCEFYPLEAVKTNIHGTQNVITAAINNNVRKVVVLSTDKAVYPINAMGQSKALMEKLVTAAGRSLTKQDTIFCLTRYGNVMASRGSIIPLIINQINNSDDLTITDPNMTRFLMSLKDSVDLVMHAFIHGKQGDLFVQKAPASTVGDLVQALKKLFKSNSDIKIIGTRHGEKLYESLVSREEMIKAEDMGNYFKIPADNRDLNYSKYYTDGDESISTIEDYNSHNTERLDPSSIKKLLSKLEIVKKSLKN